MKETTFGIIAVVLIIFMITVGCGHGISSGDGKKIGQVIQMGQHGMVCQTYEGKIVRGGFGNGSGVQGGVFDFTVENPKIIDQLNKAMEDRSEIEITYKKVTFSSVCACESDHFVTEVKVISDPCSSKSAADPKEQKRQELLRQLKELGSQQ